jgi:hypothetical protein
MTVPGRVKGGGLFGGIELFAGHDLAVTNGLRQVDFAGGALFLSKLTLSQ